MKSMATAVLAVLAFLTLCVFQPKESRSAVPEERVIAVVMGAEITGKQLEPDTTVMEQSRANMSEVQFHTWVDRYRKNKLSGYILGRLLEQYAKDHAIEATDAEIHAFMKKSHERDAAHRKEWQKDREDLLKKLESSTLSESEKEHVRSRLETLENILEVYQEMDTYERENQAEARKIKIHIAKRFINRWKLNKSLFDRYGGRVIFQQAGPEPIDAYRRFLEEHEKKGSFRILDKDFEAPFWNYFVNDAMHAFYPKEEGATFMNTPWWLLEEDRNRQSEPSKR